MKKSNSNNGWGAPDPCGSQAAEDGYPANVVFRSVAVVRNIDQGPVQVTPVVRFLRNGTAESVSLNAFSLGPGESRVLDLSREQKEGRLPADLRQASLELTPDSGDDGIVAELFNYDEESGGYVAGPTMTSYPSRSTASIWRTDGTFQTTVMVGNTAAEDDEVTVKLYSDAGTYEKSFPVVAGGLVKINVKELPLANTHRLKSMPLGQRRLKTEVCTGKRRAPKS